MNTVNLTINGKPVSVPAGSTILDAAKQLNIKIPTLCYCEKLGCGTAYFTVYDTTEAYSSANG